MRALRKGDCFGEKALAGDYLRTANVVCGKGGCTCLVVDRETFSMFIGNIDQTNTSPQVTKLSYLIGKNIRFKK